MQYDNFYISSSKKISPLTIRVIGESLGIKEMEFDMTNLISNEVTFRLTQLLKMSIKYMHHEKRNKLTCSDLAKSFKIHNFPFFIGKNGSTTKFTKLRTHSFPIFIDKEFIKLKKFRNSKNYDIHLEEYLKSEVIVLDGIPREELKENLNIEILNLQKLLNIIKERKEERVLPNVERTKPQIEAICKPNLSFHPLSAELQKFYRDLTEASVGCFEARRQEALQALMSPIAIPLLPYLSSFIVLGVHLNIINGDLALLIYLMRMLRALLDNPYIYIDKYLHELLPAAISCVVARHLCSRPILDNHWALRDFAARMVAHIVYYNSTSINGIKARVIDLYKNVLDNLQTFSPPLDTLYGVIQGLIALGPKISKSILHPRIKAIGYIVQTLPRNPTTLGLENKQAAERIQKLIVNWLTEFNLEEPQKCVDLLAEYRAKYGFFGTFMYMQHAQNRMTGEFSIKKNSRF